MELLVAGLSHHSAPIALRERIALGPTELPAALGRLVSEGAFDEGLILSTCNRTEVYARPRSGAGPAAAIQFIESLRPDLRTDMARHLYHHHGDEAVRHLFRVVSGLDSMVLGEVEIARQVSVAYDLACSAGTAGPLLHRVVPRALQIGKRVRTETKLARGIASVAGAAIGLADRVFRKLDECRIVAIGAGATVDTALRVLRPRATGPLLILNRTVEKAETLAATFGGRGAGLDGLARHVAEADIVIVATDAPMPLVKDAEVAPLLKRRKFRPLLLIDLGVPRDIEPALGKRSGIYLHDVDDLRAIAERGRTERKLEIPRAEAILDTALSEFRQRRRQLDTAPAIRALLDGLLGHRNQIIAGEKGLSDEERAIAERVSGRFVDLLVRRLAPRFKDGTVPADEILEAFGVDPATVATSETRTGTRAGRRATARTSARDKAQPDSKRDSA